MNAPNRGPRAFTRYVALGDSFTEGLSDADPKRANTYVGWADRLAAHLARVAGEDNQVFGYANLAVRGRLLATIAGPQLEDAISLQPDLVSIVGGGNDILRPKADIDALAARLEEAVGRLRATGADVLMATPEMPRSSRPPGAGPQRMPRTSGRSPAATTPMSSICGAWALCETGGCGPRTGST